MEMVRRGSNVAVALHPSLRGDDGDVHARPWRVGKYVKCAEQQR
jgi:hypothetical protein